MWTAVDATFTSKVIRSKEIPFIITPLDDFIGVCYSGCILSLELFVTHLVILCTHLLSCYIHISLFKPMSCYMTRDKDGFVCKEKS